MSVVELKDLLDEGVLVCVIDVCWWLDWLEVGYVDYWMGYIFGVVFVLFDIEFLMYGELLEGWYLFFLMVML